MVFFNCNACGESVKKNQVEKHYQFKCRSCTILSCVDCGKDFHGEAYKEHIKCMTEDEKYGGKNYKAKANANKGEKKQEDWIERVESAIDNVKDYKLKNLLERVKGYTNIPRKKAKFENFLRNSLRIQGSLPSQAWEAISAEIEKASASSVPTSNGISGTDDAQNSLNNASTSSVSENEDDCSKKLNKRERKEERKRKGSKTEKKDKQNEIEHNPKKDKKRKRPADDEEFEEDQVKKKKSKTKYSQEESNDQETEEVPSKKKRKGKKKEETSNNSMLDASTSQTEDTDHKGKFDWEQTIVKVLSKADDKEITLKKLKKKVLAAYGEHGGSASLKSEEAFIAKFNKKVTKNPKFRVLKDRVKLIH